MNIGKILTAYYKGKLLSLRSLKQCNVSDSYIASLNNEQKYLETKSHFVTIETQKQYISKIDSSEDQLILGLFNEDELIATSGCQSASKSEYTLGVFVFDKWRKQGFGKILIWMACTLLNQTLQVVAFKAGIKKDNQPSLKSFCHCGFSVIGENSTDYQVRLRIDNLKKPTLLKITRKINNGN